MTTLDELIEQALGWMAYHKRRGHRGRIELLAANIRYLALIDARQAVQAEKDKAP